MPEKEKEGWQSAWPNIWGSQGAIYEREEGAVLPSMPTPTAADDNSSAILDLLI